MVRPFFVVVAILAMGSMAFAAQIPGGGFEGDGPAAGLPAGFVSAGNVQVVTGVGNVPGTGTVSPYEGNSFLAISSRGSVPAVLAGQPPFGFLTGNPAGMTGGTGSGVVTQYAGFSFDFSVNIWSTIHAYVNIATGSDVFFGRNDLVAIYLQDHGGNGQNGGQTPVNVQQGTPVPVSGWVVGPTSTPVAPFQGLASTDFDAVAINDTTVGSFSQGQTGWFHFFEYLGVGDYTLFFLVADQNDFGGEIGLFVDDLQLNEVVPEPGTWLLVGLGSLGLLGFRRYRRRTVKA